MNSTQLNRETKPVSATVITREGCTLVFGALSLIQVRDLSRDGSPDDVMSPDLARLVGATFAYGSSDAVATLLARTLAENPAAGRQEKPVQSYSPGIAASGLPESVATVSIGLRADILGSRMSFTRLTDAGRRLPAGTYPLYLHAATADDRMLHQHAARWCVVRELDGATIAAMFGAYDGTQPELADAVVDDGFPTDITLSAKRLTANKGHRG